MLALKSIMGEGNGTPLRYSCLENPMDGGTWWAAVHGVAKSRIQLNDLAARVLSSLKEFLWSNNESAFSLKPFLFIYLFYLLFFLKPFLKINTVFQKSNHAFQLRRVEYCWGPSGQPHFHSENWSLVSEKGAPPSGWAPPSKGGGRRGQAALVLTAGWNVPPPGLIRVVSFCEDNHQIKCFNYRNYICISSEKRASSGHGIHFPEGQGALLRGEGSVWRSPF